MTKINGWFTSDNFAFEFALEFAFAFEKINKIQS